MLVLGLNETLNLLSRIKDLYIIHRTWRKVWPWFLWRAATATYLRIKCAANVAEVYIRSVTMQPKWFWIQIWRYQTFLCWDSQQGRELAKSGRNNFFFNSANLILMSIGKSGIIKFEFTPTYIVLILKYILWLKVQN